jgi:hypothetical protein
MAEAWAKMAALRERDLTDAAETAQHEKISDINQERVGVESKLWRKQLR